jgi:hypothetical protein
MSTTAAERATQALPGKARARVLTKQKLKWMLYAGLTGFLALAAARYGDDWWTVGRFAFVVATFLVPLLRNIAAAKSPPATPIECLDSGGRLARAASVRNGSPIEREVGLTNRVDMHRYRQ